MADIQAVNRVLRFIVDSNVGRLARWLRLLGYDALFIHPIADGTLVNIALAENRILLTKDTHILERKLVTSGQVAALLIESDKVLEQLRQVVYAYHLDPHRHRFTLCPECNKPLLPRAKDEVKGLVPPYVFQTQNRFTYCPHCQRYYWPGTHWERMTERLDRLLGEESA